MVTQLALETLSLSNQNGGDNSWPWCDDCSMDEAMPGILGGGDHNQGKDFYFTDDSLGKSRVLVERSVGATIAFLMATADVLPAPTCSTTACPNGVSCCSGQSCSNGVCCKPTLGACQHDADCCGGPATSVCRNGSCAPRAAGICQQEGQSCEDGPAACCADSAGARQCGRSANGVNVCCGGSGTTCRSSVECCDGFCDITAGSIGVCRKLPLGAGCTASAQCQDGALCESNGAPPTISRPQGTCCNPSSTGTLDCTTDADCCTGVCGSIGNDQFKCMCAAQGVVCSSDLDCCAGNACTGGTCQPVCRVDNTPCQDNSQCCGSSVCCGGVTGGPVCKAVCGCLPHGGFCQTDSDCCAPNSCQNGRCLEACGHAGASCQSGAECCSGGCGDSICECEATGTTCVETADCCVGNLCCAGVGGAPNVCRTSCCQADGASCQNNNDCCGGSVCCANLGFTCTAVCPVVK
jgi:hypothetical protein